MASLLDVSVDNTGRTPRIQVAPRQPPEDAAAFSAAVAIHMLLDAWQLIATDLDLRANVPLEDPGEAF